MAQDVGTVYVQVEPSGRGFGRKIEGDLGDSIDKVSDHGSKSLFSRLGGAFTKVGKAGLTTIGALTGGIVGLAAKGGFERALAIENAQAKLKGLGHSAGDVSEIMNDAMAAVKGTAFGLGDAATVAASLSASGVASGEQMTKVLKTVGDTAQISGRSLTDIGTIFSSVAARGKLQGDDMLQLMSSGIPVLQLLGKHLGKTSAEVSDMVSKGKIDFQTFADAMQEGLGGAALSAGSTFQGALSNVKAAMGRLGEEFQTPVLNAMRDTLNKFNPAIDAVAKAMKPFADSFGDKVAPAVDRAGRMLDKLGSAGDKGISQLTGKLKNLPSGLQNAMGGLQQFKGYFNKDIREALAIDGDPFANALNRIGKGVDSLTGPFKSLGSKLADTGIGGRIAGMGSTIATGFGKLTSSADSNIRVFGAKMGSGMQSALDKLGDSKVGQAFSKMGQSVKNAVAPMISGIGNVFGGLGDMVAGPLQSGLGKIGSTIGGFFAPGNFMKFFGVGAIIAALVAGIGLLNQSMDGQLANTIADISGKAPAMIGQFTARIMASLPEVMASGTSVIVNLLNGITNAAPSLIAGAARIIATLVTGLADALPQIIPAAIAMITTIITALIEQLPTIMNAGMQLLDGIIQGLIAALPQLIAQIPTILNALLTGIVSMLPMILMGGMQILMGLIQGLVNAIPMLVAQIPTIINSIISTLTSNLPLIIQMGIQVLLSLIDGLVNAIPQLVTQVPVIIANIVNAISSNLPQIIKAGIQIIIALAGGLIQAMPKILAAIPQIVRGIKDGFSQVNWGEVGMNIIRGIKDGIVRFASTLWDAAKNAAKGALDNVKNFLGIHSPSRVFRDQVGVMIGRGMAEGIEDSQRLVDRSMDRIAKGLTLNGMSIGTPAFSMLPKDLMGNSGQAALRDNGGPPITMNVSTMDPMSAAREATRLVAFSMGG